MDLGWVTVLSRGQQVSFYLLKLPWRFVYMGQKKVRPDKPYEKEAKNPWIIVYEDVCYKF